LVAIGLAALGPPLGNTLFWMVFIPVGLIPVTLRLMTNYAMELAPPPEHPRYISTLGLCFAIPVMIGAIPVGWLMDVVGYTPVFIAGSMVVGFGGWMTFWLAEPRYREQEYIQPTDPAAVV